MMGNDLLTAKDIDQEIALTSTQEFAASELAMGKTKSIVAKELNLSTQTVDIWGTNTKFLAQIEKEREWLSLKMRGRLLTLSDKALDKLEDVLKSGDEKLSFSAAKEVLRQGIAADIAASRVSARDKSKGGDDDTKSIPPIQVNLINVAVEPESKIVDLETEVKVLSE